MSDLIYDALRRVSAKQKTDLHIPGHKGGRGLSKRLQQAAFRLDMTELPGTDNLQNPRGVLREAQKRAAKLWGAGRSFYLTGGTTLGHRSVIAGLILAGAKPVFVERVFDHNRDMALEVPIQAVKSALDRHPNAVGMVLTNPTYYGVCSPVWAIGRCLHNSNKFLIVDEAHGAHFAFCDRLPHTALEDGADVAVQSMHKTLPVPGQCSLLHVHRESLVDAERVHMSLQLLQTTSPSYMLMAAMDEAVEGLSKWGTRRIETLVKAIQRMKQELRRSGVLDFADEQTLKVPQDSTRMVVDFSNVGISGSAAEQFLREEFGIFAEMADSRHVILIPTICSDPRELQYLKDILGGFGKSKLESMPGEPYGPLPRIQLTCDPQKVWGAQGRWIPTADSVGKIAAEIVSACPPGAAVAVPGQLLDQETVAYLLRTQTADTIRVMD